MKVIRKSNKAEQSTPPGSLKSKKTVRKRKLVAKDKRKQKTLSVSDSMRQIPWRPQYKSKAADEEG